MGNSALPLYVYVCLGFLIDEGGALLCYGLRRRVGSAKAVTSKRNLSRVDISHVLKYGNITPTKMLLPFGRAYQTVLPDKIRVIIYVSYLIDIICKQINFKHIYLNK